ncbi:MAG TPA: thioredoxin domain-containing protein [Solirubrobacterales bacterium]|nr:thioredoxin domain-containing protein [Solirubrobacterales bacterium]
MSDKREREGRREERLREESEADAGERRTRLLQLAAGSVFLAIVVVAVLVVVNAGSNSGGDAANLEGAAEVDSLLAGIPQRGLVLGDPRAKAELVEYGDMQCPVCKAYSEDFVPQVIESKIRSGKAKVVFRNFAFIGEQSETAGAAVLAAGAQGRGWEYLELFYRNQGIENSGYADDEFLTAVAKAAGVEDIARWDRDRKSAKFTDEVAKTTEQAQDLGLTGTPSFAVEGPSSDGLELLGTPNSPGEVEAAIDAAA